MNPRANKAKGSLWERDLATAFRESGVFPDVERAPRWGSVDKGDLVNTGPFLIEAKVVKTIDLAGFIGEAEVEAANAGRDFPVVVIKRRSKPVLAAYVVMTLEDWIELARLAVAQLETENN